MDFSWSGTIIANLNNENYNYHTGSIIVCSQIQYHSLIIQSAGSIYVLILLFMKVHVRCSLIEAAECNGAGTTYTK